MQYLPRGEHAGAMTRARKIQRVLDECSDGTPVGPYSHALAAVARARLLLVAGARAAQGTDAWFVRSMRSMRSVPGTRHQVLAAELVGDVVVNQVHQVLHVPDVPEVLCVLCVLLVLCVPELDIVQVVHGVVVCRTASCPVVCQTIGGRVQCHAVCSRLIVCVGSVQGFLPFQQRLWPAQSYHGCTCLLHKQLECVDYLRDGVLFLG